MANTILVVEDDATLREVLAYTFRREQYDVDTACDGPSGLRLARSNVPDLVVLDLMLPGMSGLDVCRILRAESATLIMMVTARDAEIDRVVGLEVGADDYITKPFSLRELTARVKALIRRDRLSKEAASQGGTGPSAQLIRGRFALDVGRHEIRRDGEILALRPREFDLLEYFLRHPLQVLSRQMILDSVWTNGYDGGTRTVDVHVRWLREKIENDASHPEHILTARHLGYRFAP